MRVGSPDWPHRGDQDSGAGAACSGPPRRLRQQIAIERIVGVLEKGLLPAIAALGHMVSNAGYNETRETGHAQHIDIISVFSKLAP